MQFLSMVGITFCIASGPLLAVINIAGPKEGMSLVLLLALNAFTFGCGVYAAWMYGHTRRYGALIRKLEGR